MKMSRSTMMLIFICCLVINLLHIRPTGANYHSLILSNRGACSELAYICSDRTACFPLNTRCDQHIDCPDGSDENHCPVPTTPLYVAQPCSTMGLDWDTGNNAGSRCVEGATCVNHVNWKEGGICLCPPGSNGDGLTTGSGCRYPNCPEGMTQDQYSCYQFINTPLSFSEALQACHLIGAELWSLGNEDDVPFLRNKVEDSGSVGSMYWTGYNDRTWKGIYSTPEGSPPVSKHMWKDNEDYQQGQDKSCVVLDSGSKANYKLGKAYCDTLHKAICKRVQIKSLCPPGWMVVEGKCVLLMGVTLRDYYSAYMTCVSLGSDLLHLNNQSKDFIDGLKYLLPHGYSTWIGLNFAYLPNSGDQLLQWTNGNKATHISEAKPVDEKRRCYGLNQEGVLTPEKCSKELPFLCGHNTGVRVTCPNGSKRFGSMCYKIKDPDTDWFKARASCRSMGGDLITVTSETEQRFLIDIINQDLAHGSYWLGLRKVDNGQGAAYSKDSHAEYEKDGKSNKYRIEGDSSGFLQWIDGQLLHYSNFQNDYVAHDSANQSLCFVMVPRDTDVGSGSVYLANSSYQWLPQKCNENAKYICEYVNTPCVDSTDCHALASCHMGQCRCLEGYEGDGLKVCVDVDECIERPCSPQATCTNIPGSHYCACNVNYIGDGFTCIDFRSCSSDVECHRKALCGRVDGLCACLEGYTGNGKTTCVNINECETGSPCHKDADCTDTDGGFECSCRPGYRGNGVNCTEIPTSCEMMRKRGDVIIRGTYYEIDPDGPRGIQPFNALCEVHGDVGVTVLTHNSMWRVQVPGGAPYSKTRSLYYGVNMEQIVSLVDHQEFCYQDMLFECDGAVGVMDTTYWVDGRGQEHHLWAGASTNGSCLCGEIGSCLHPDSMCNCDGKRNSNVATADGKLIDFGKIVDRSMLPVSEIHSGGSSSSAKAHIFVGPLKCAPRAIDMAESCSDRNASPNSQGLASGSTRYVDDFTTQLVLTLSDKNLEGPSSNTQQLLIVFCDLKSHGLPVTQIPIRNFGRDGQTFKASYTGPVDIEYTSSMDVVMGLIEQSKFCSQYYSYGGLNAPLSGSYYTVGPPSPKQPRRPLSPCPCSRTRTCEGSGPQVQCSSDVTDGKEHFDFGWLTKDSVPMTSFGRERQWIQHGEGSWNLSVGWLSCASRPFGIEPSCQQYRRKGFTRNYTYLIDPDGPPIYQGYYNAEPFYVVCQMDEELKTGVTVVHHDKEDWHSAANGELAVKYISATLDQVISLVDRQSYCRMEVEYKCTKSALHTSNQQGDSYWRNRWGWVKKYWAGDGKGGFSQSCSCGIDGSCPGSTYDPILCNCDVRDATTRTDKGILSNKDDLPMITFNFRDVAGKESSAMYRLGPLVCHELFRTCNEIWEHSWRYYSLQSLTDGPYVVDPDGQFGLNPFHVYCSFPYHTILYISNGRQRRIDSKTDSYPASSLNAKPNATCAKFRYEDASLQQIQSLVAVAGFCSQSADYECINSPLSTHSHWRNRDGHPMPGWAGNAGGNECACGMTDMCDGGVGVACNCDVTDGIRRIDKGIFVDKSMLPVSEVCLGYLNPGYGGARHGLAQVNLGPLICASSQFGIEKTCQALRDRGVTESGSQLIDPDGAFGIIPPFTVYCEMHEDPAIGITIITNKNSGCQKISSGEAELKIQYNVANQNWLKNLIDESVYCTQELSYTCYDGAELNLTPPYGWYSKHGGRQDYWGGNTPDGQGCLNGRCNCRASNKENKSEDGGLLLDKTVLPVSSVRLGPAGQGSRCVSVGPLKCYSVYKNCDEIYQKKLFKSLNTVTGETGSSGTSGRYPVDPDSAGGVDIFTAECQFINDIGVTWVPRKAAGRVVPIWTKGPGNTTVGVDYDELTLDQIKALVISSTYCQQELKYQCTKRPLINNFNPPKTYFVGYDGTPSRNWAGADNMDITGCACSVLGRCPFSHTCRCDALSLEPQLESGLVTNLSKLPISKVSYASSSSTDAVTDDFISIGSIGCAPQPFGLPRTCQDAYRRMVEAGEIGGVYVDVVAEVLIQPDTKLPPYLVHCDMSNYGKFGVTVIGVKEGKKLPMGPTVSLSYDQATIQQVNALVTQSLFCLQPVRVDCRNLVLNFRKGTDGSYWVGGDGRAHYYLGRGSQGEGCTCGSEGSCAGNYPPGQNVSRLCNCGLSDGAARSDGGLIQVKKDLPISEVHLNHLPYENSGSISVGDLYCADQPFDLNECALGYHDCVPEADCVNLPGSFSCICREGYRGRGRPSDLPANGRQCPDDDECALGLCAENSTTCVNTAGSYRCECKKGFTGLSNNQCQDINECETGKPKCHPEARCVNTWGSYSCVCMPGYQGDGQNCSEVGVCRFWGDPHYRLFSGRVTSFQGACRYLLSRDACANGKPIKGEQPSFEVVQKNWRGWLQNEKAKVSWAKEIYIRVYGVEILLAQERKVLVNGKKISYLPVRPLPAHPDLYIVYEGTHLTVKTHFMQLRWNGATSGDLTLSPLYLRGAEVCGVCGQLTDSYPDIPPPIGPACELPPGQNLTSKLYGESWTYGEDDDPECMLDCGGSDIGCEAGSPAYIEAESKCRVLTDVTGKFQDCVVKIGKRQSMEILRSCIYDVCLTGSDGAEHAVCEGAVSLVDACYMNTGVRITGWREKNFCPLQCPTGMIYESCGSACPPTCTSGDELSVCVAMCMEGCFCPAGLVREGDACIRKELCGCEHEGLYYPVGSSVISENCTELCTCETVRGAMMCQTYGCSAAGSVCGASEEGFRCTCGAGYTGNGTYCHDTDECALNPCPDAESSYCVNTVGSYECACRDGYTKDRTETGVKICKDVDECLLGKHECDQHATCVNEPGSYRCTCNTGTKQSNYGTQCEDIDECQSGDHSCDRESAVCRNVFGSYECDCKQGFKKVNEKLCSDIDECMDENTECSGAHFICTNTPGSYNCTCQPGYHHLYGICEDIDECELGIHSCRRNTGEKCFNVDGSYQCVCDTPFYQNVYTDSSAQQNHLKCVDVDECTKDHQSTVCVPPTVGGACVNTEGSYSCMCKDGYRGDGYSNSTGCQDVNECEVDKLICGANSQCINEVPGYSCVCLTGFYSPGGSQKDCIKIATCSDSNNRLNCSTGTEVCEDGPYGPRCVCALGFLHDDEINSCRDVDECKQTDKYCTNQNQFCINTIGSFSCGCETGFELSAAGDCPDIDECATATNLCTKLGQTCTNTVGSYHCSCMSGFQPVRNETNQETDACVDINECETDDRCGCSGSADCINLSGSCYCTCKPGFIGDGRTCTDIPECSTGLAACPKHSTCVETPGSYTCRCVVGFSFNGSHCIDVDECLTGCETCDSFSSVCENLVGSYQCSCRAGYKAACKRENECIDIDECSLGLDDCDRGLAECINIPGSYRCVCRHGFTGDGRICSDIDECALGTSNCNITTSCCLNSIGSHRCKCRAGYAPETAYQCSDINECESTELNKCHRNADCENVEGSYECRCKTGYIGDGLTRCDASIPRLCDGGVICDKRARCVGQDGSGESGTVGSSGDSGNVGSSDGRKRCVCMKGYEGSGIDRLASQALLALVNEPGNTKSPGTQWHTTYGTGGTSTEGCTAVDACTLYNPCHPKADCSADGGGGGSVTCTCRLGYVGSGYECKPENPCLEEGACGKMAACRVTEGGEKQCVCPAGYRSTSDTMDCQDINECSEGVVSSYGSSAQSGACPDQNTVCVNAPGSFQCVCKCGYKKGSSGSCEDLDECTEGKHDCDRGGRADCTNTVGSYKCSCRPGYVGNGRTCTEKDECSLSCNVTTEYCEASELGHCNADLDPYCSTQSQGRCVCKSGFKSSATPSGHLCVDIKECETEKPCHEDSVCEEQSPGFTCTCKPGYVGNGIVCKDLDECSLGTSGCSPLTTTCVNTPGSFSCSCKQGYEQTSSNVNCSLILADVCGCGKNGICDSTTMTCKCNSGYQVVNTGGAKCQAVNPCNKPGVCHKLARCVRTGAGYNDYRCLCPEGMAGNGVDFCVMDACMTGAAGCSPHAYCTNVMGSAECKCKSGYVGNGYTCLTVGRERKDCDELLNDCSRNAICVSRSVSMGDLQLGKPLPGGYSGQPSNQNTSYLEQTSSEYVTIATCVCDVGYHGDGESCVDINECDDTGSGYQVHECDSNAVCVNYEGGHMCRCLPGFTGTGNNCTDINECASSDLHNCDLSISTCINQEGGFLCVCHNDSAISALHYSVLAPPPCMQPSALSSVALPSPTYPLPTLPDSESCGGELHCNPTSERCVQISNSSYKCVCKVGYQKQRNGTCSNVNECATGWRPPCHIHASCHDTDGSFRCTCREGFVGDGIKLCRPVCNPGSCPAGHACRAVEGRPQCVCECCDKLCSSPGRVCASNGRTFATYRNMVEFICKTGKNVSVSYWGSCTRKCDGVRCSGVRECQIVNNMAVCACPHCSTELRKSGPVWTVSGIMYPNMCAYLSVQCLHDVIDPIDHSYSWMEGVDCRYSRWTPWSTCSVTCGEGTRKQFRNVLQEPLITNRTCAETLERSLSCYRKPCPNDVCDGYEGCSRPYEYCVEYVISMVTHSTYENPRTVPICKCPECPRPPIDTGYNPMCAQIGWEMVTASTPCQLKRKACLAGLDYRLLHNGPCRDRGQNLPAECSLVHHKVKVKGVDGGGKEYTSAEELEINGCAGACQSTLCCQPSEYEYRKVNVTSSLNYWRNTEVDTKTAEVLFIQKCACVTGDMEKSNMTLITILP